jgi:hypothetical protein
MLTVDLRRYAETSPQITRALTGYSEIQWAQNSSESPSSSDVSSADVLSQARSHFSGLRLEAALQLFERDKRENRGDLERRHYFERIQINIVLGKWAEALSLSSKRVHVEAIFLSAVACGRFKKASFCLSLVCREIAWRKNGKAGGEYLATSWDLAHMHLYVTLAVSSPNAAGQRLEQLQKAYEYDLGEVARFTSLFVQRRYPEFWRAIGESRNRFQVSYYVKPCAAKIERAIRLNVIRIAAKPYSNVTFQKLADIVGTDKRTIFKGLIALVRLGRLTGTVDCVEERWHGSKEKVPEKRLVKLCRRASKLRERFEVVKFRSEVGLPPRSAAA